MGSIEGIPWLPTQTPNTKYPLLFTYEQFALDLHPEMSALVGGSGYLPHLFMVQKISITSHLYFDK